MLNLLRWSILLIGATVVVAPLMQLIFESRNVDIEIWQHLRDNQIPNSLLETLIFTLGSTLTALLIGSLFALLGLSLPRLNFVLKISMALLIAIPTYVFGFLMLSFIDFSGPLQLGLKKFLGPDYYFEPRLRFWAILIYGVSTAPYVYFSVDLGLKSQIKNLIEASYSLKAGVLKTLRRVLIPALKPWALAGSSLVALEALSDFGFVDLFGLNTLSRLLYKSWGSLFSFGGAARLSLILIVVCLLLMALNHLANKSFIQRDNSSQQDYSNLFDLNNLLKCFLYFVGLLGVFIFSLLPLVLLISYASDLNLWAELPWLNAAWSSLCTTIVTSCFVLFFTSILFFSANAHNKFSLFLLNFLNIGYGLPGTLLAVAIYIFFSQILNLKILSDHTGLLFLSISLIYFIKFSSLGLRSLQSQQKQLNPNLFESASLLAPDWKVFWNIKLKLYSPALRLSLFLLFLEIIKELPASLMIKPISTPSLAVRIHQYASESDWARASVYSLVLLIILSLILLLRKAFQLALESTK